MKAFVSEFLEASGKLNKNNPPPIQPANSQLHPMSEEAGKVIQLDKKKKSSEKDLKESEKWYRQAAEQGNGDSQYALAWMYDEGKGVKQKFSDAIKFYKLSAGDGNTSAQYKLGIMYAEGKGVEKDFAEAVKWLRMYANQGYEKAKTKLKNFFST